MKLGRALRERLQLSRAEKPAKTTSRRDPDAFTFTDLLVESSIEVSARPRRLITSVVGAVLGIGALVATVGFSQTSGAHIADQFDSVAGRQAIIKPLSEVDADGTETAVTALRWDSATQLENISGVEGASLISQLTISEGVISAVQVNDPSTPPVQQPGLFAASPTVLDTAGAALQSGRMFDTGHDGRADRVAVISARAAERLGVGDLRSQPSIFLGGMAYAVIGIYDNAKYFGDLQDAVIIPSETARHDFDLTSPEQVLARLVVNSGPILAEQAPLALSPNSPSDIVVTAPKGPSDLQKNVQSDVNLVFVLLSLVVLLAGGFGIANVMMLSVMERTGEIGLRRAVGATQKQIAQQFIAEAMIIGILGGLLGSAVGVIAIEIFAVSQGWPAVTNPVVAAAGVAIGALVGLVAGGLPARRAAKIEPVDALRGE